MSDRDQVIGRAGKVIRLIRVMRILRVFKVCISSTMVIIFIATIVVLR